MITSSSSSERLNIDSLPRVSTQYAQQQQQQPQYGLHQQQQQQYVSSIPVKPISFASSFPKPTQQMETK